MTDVKVGDVVTIDKVPVGATYVLLVGSDKRPVPGEFLRERVLTGGLCIDPNSPREDWYCIDNELQNSVYQIVALPGPTTAQATTPAYYQIKTPIGTVDVMAIIDALNLNFNRGCVLKYVCRAGRKTPDALEDLKKARHCIDQEIRRLEATEAWVAD